MFKVGDRVVFNDYIQKSIDFYTNEVFTIIKIDYECVATLDKMFNGCDASHISHLRLSIKEDRVLKLKKLESLCLK